MALVPTVPTSSVYPSGALLATMSAPMLPPAPPRLSMMNDWPSRSDSFCATMRPRMSVVPPAGKGTIVLTDFTG